MTDSFSAEAVQRGSISTISSITPTWEDFKAATERAADLHRRQVELEQCRTETLEPMRKRLNDPDNPVSAEELREEPERTRELMPDDAARFLDGCHIAP